MLITNTLLLGGAAYAFVQQRRKANARAVVVADAEAALAEEVARSQRNAAVSTLSLGMSVAGMLASMPGLNLLSVPLNVYTNLPLFEESFATLAGRENKFGSIMASVVLSGALISNHVTTANLLDWLVQRGRLTSARLRRSGYQATELVTTDLQKWVAQALGKRPETVWLVSEQAEQQIAFSDLQAGDLILCRRGDFVGVSGEVVQGAGELFDWLALTKPPMLVETGDAVTPRMMVLDGAITVRVDSVA